MTGAMRTRRMTEMTQGIQRTGAADMLSTLRAVPGLRRAWPAKRDSAPASVIIECVDDRGYLRAGHGRWVASCPTGSRGLWFSPTATPPPTRCSTSTRPDGSG